MKVLVTGGAGFAGSHLIEHLVQNTNWEIVSLDSYRHRGDSERHVKHDRVTYHQHDCSHPISARLIRKIGHVNFIFNLASDSHVDRSITDPVPFVENNVKITLHMLEYARMVNGLQAFFQISTDEVYGAAPEGVNHKEWSVILPSNPYSASKAAQEAIAISYWRTYGVPIVITNTMNMIGERQDEEKYVPMCIKNIRAEKLVTIHGNESYIGKRHYLHARNHADALLFLALNHDPVKYYDADEIVYPSRFNVVGDIEMDNLELAQLVASMMDRELKYKLVDFHNSRPGHDRRYSLDGGKIAALGWKAPVPFDESLRRTIDWTIKNSEWL